MKTQRIREQRRNSSMGLISSMLLLILLLYPEVASARSTSPLEQSSGIAYDSTTGRTYVAQPASNAVFVFAPGDTEILTILRTPASPRGVAIDSLHKRLYISSDSTRTITAYNTQTYKPIQRYRVGGHPGGLALQDGGKQLVITDRVSGSLRLLAPLAAHGSPSEVFFLGFSTTPTLIVAPKIVPSGMWAMAWARGFMPGETVLISWGVRRITRAKANHQGTVISPFQVPPMTTPEKYLVILYGTQSTLTESYVVKVVPAPPIPKQLMMQSKLGKKPSLVQQLLSATITLPFPAAAPIHKGKSYTSKTTSKTKSKHPIVVAQGGTKVPVIALAAPLLLLLLCLVVVILRRRGKKAKKGQGGNGPISLDKRAKAKDLKKAS